MLRTLLILALSVCFIMPATAQRKKKKGGDKVTFTKEFKMPKALMKIGRIVGADENSVIGIAGKARQTTGSLINNLVNPLFKVAKIEVDFFVTKISNDGKLVIKEIDEDYGDVIYSRNDGGEITLLTYGYSKKEKTEVVQVLSVNEQTASVENKGVIESIIFDSNREKNKERHGFYFDESEDESHFLIFVDEPDKKKESESFRYKVLTKDLKVLWEGKDRFGSEERNVIITNRTVDNNGNVYVLAKIYDQGTNTVKKRKDYHHEIKMYPYGGKEQTFKFKFTDKYVREMNSVAVGDTVYCAGYYSDEFRDNALGTFLVKYNIQTGEKLSENFHEFSPEIIAEGEHKRVQKSIDKKVEKGKEVRNPYLYLDYVLVDKKGSVVLVGEQYHLEMRTTTTTTNGVTTTKTTPVHIYESIFINKINPDGSLAWEEKISKRQTGLMTTSYNLFEKDGELKFIFNDSEANHSAKYAKKRAKKGAANSSAIKGSISVISTVDLDKGTKTDKIFMKRKGTKMTIIPMTSWQNKETGEITVVAIKGILSKKTKIVRIK